MISKESVNLIGSGQLHSKSGNTCFGYTSQEDHLDGLLVRS